MGAFVRSSVLPGWKDHPPVILHAHDRPVFRGGFVEALVQFANVGFAIIPPALRRHPILMLVGNSALQGTASFIRSSAQKRSALSHTPAPG